MKPVWSRETKLPYEAVKSKNGTDKSTEINDMKKTRGASIQSKNFAVRRQRGVSITLDMVK